MCAINPRIVYYAITGYGQDGPYRERAGHDLNYLGYCGLLNIERRHGKDEFVIEKALVKMDSPAMQYFVSRRSDWAASDLFASPGPRQFWGPTTHQLPISVALNSGSDSLMFRIG